MTSSMVSSNSGQVIGPILGLVVLDFVVITGNSLIIAAVFTHAKLRRSTTNKFVVSLAIADLMVGLAVLPFSSVNEVLRHWPFGFSWCRIWLALDVWLCTASILNLCAISLDRYLAISRPFQYLSLMSPYRAKVLIVTVWILSFIICLPPLISLHEKLNDDRVKQPSISGTSQGAPFTSSYNDAASDVNISATTPPSGGFHACELNSEPAYIIYSACGSFWIPMIIMVVFYWRIYKTANMATAAIQRGFITSHGTATAGSKVTGQSNETGSRTVQGGASSTGKTGDVIHAELRVHRGGGRAYQASKNMSPSMCSLAARNSSGSLGDVMIDFTQRTSFDGGSSARHRLNHVVNHRQFGTPSAGGGFASGVAASGTAASHRSLLVGERVLRQAKSEHDLPRIVVTSPACTPATTLAVDADSGAQLSAAAVRLNTLSGSLSQLQVDAKKTSPFGRLNQQLRSLNREKKAAKTIGVIVGCFVVCWAPFFTVYLLPGHHSSLSTSYLGTILHCLPLTLAPFFTVYLLQAFCFNCTPKTLFDIFFWLGYLNSLANPIIYGLCSRDFRYAFVKLLRCRCERRPQPALGSPWNLRRQNSRIGTVLRGFRLQIATENERDVSDSYS